MLNCLFVGIGGFVGSILRYLIGLIPLTEDMRFPIKTLFINVIGAFAIGIITAVLAKNIQLSPRLLLFLKVGVCGGFTTFSTFALESVELFQAGNLWMMLLYMALSVILCVSAVLIAEAMIR